MICHICEDVVLMLSHPPLLACILQSISNHWLADHSADSRLHYVLLVLTFKFFTCHIRNNYSETVVGNEILAPACYANEPLDNNRLHSSCACADGLIYLTEGIVYAPSINLFHALLVSIKHTLSCSRIHVWKLLFPCGLGSAAVWVCQYLHYTILKVLT